MNYKKYTLEEEAELVRKSLNGDKASTEILIQIMDQYINTTIKSFKIPYDSITDAYQEAVLGVLKFIPKYDNTVKVLFFTGCKYWVNDALIKYVARNKYLVSGLWDQHYEKASAQTKAAMDIAAMPPVSLDYVETPGGDSFSEILHSGNIDNPVDLLVLQELEDTINTAKEKFSINRITPAKINLVQDGLLNHFKSAGFSSSADTDKSATTISVMTVDPMMYE